VTADAPALLYVIAGCSHCQAARAELSGRGVPFREIDVGVRREIVPELLKLTGGRRIVPVVVANGRVLVAPHGGSSF
jgi:glutaredoxin